MTNARKLMSYFVIDNVFALMIYNFIDAMKDNLATTVVNKFIQ